MPIRIELPAHQEEELRHQARRMGVRPEDLARALVVDLLDRQGDDFDAVAARVIRKNTDLYGRLR